MIKLPLLLPPSCRMIDQYFRPPVSDPAIVSKDWLLMTIRKGTIQNPSDFPALSGGWEGSGGGLASILPGFRSFL